VLGEAVAGTVGSAAALMAYAVRAPSSSLFGPSVYRGYPGRRSLALTFDDGPSEGTPEILSILSEFKLPATFFQCGANIRRLPSIARDVLSERHEIGNHTQTHPNLCFHSPKAVADELRQAQATIEDTLQHTPRLMRAPFGVRWFGFREAQRQLGLLGVMWTVIGNDWKLEPADIAERLLRGASNGAIFCLHDGRELQPVSRTSATAQALRIAIPKLLDRGFQFETVNSILCSRN